MSCPCAAGKGCSLAACLFPLILPCERVSAFARVGHAPASPREDETAQAFWCGNPRGPRCARAPRDEAMSVTRRSLASGTRRGRSSFPLRVLVLRQHGVGLRHSSSRRRSFQHRLLLRRRVRLRIRGAAADVPSRLRRTRIRTLIRELSDPDRRRAGAHRAAERLGVIVTDQGESNGGAAEPPPSRPPSSASCARSARFRGPVRRRRRIRRRRIGRLLLGSHDFGRLASPQRRRLRFRLGVVLRVALGFRGFCSGRARRVALHRGLRPWRRGIGPGSAPLSSARRKVRMSCGRTSSTSARLRRRRFARARAQVKVDEPDRQQAEMPERGNSEPAI